LILTNLTEQYIITMRRKIWYHGSKVLLQRSSKKYNIEKDSRNLRKKILLFTN